MKWTYKQIETFENIMLRHQIRKIESMITNLVEDNKPANELLNISESTDTNPWFTTSNDIVVLDTHCTGLYDPGLTFDDLWYW